MHKKLMVLLIAFLPCTVMAQTVFDSLSQVYTVPTIFMKRKELNIPYSKYIQQELAKISNPETRQLAACAIASNLYGYPFLTDNELHNLIDNVLQQPVSEDTRNRAAVIKAEFDRELVGSKVKPLAFPTSQGDTVRLTDLYTSGKDFVIIDLWATWCGPCVASMKKFNSLKEKYNIEIYSISLDDTMDKVQKFAAKNPAYTWPIVYGGRSNGLHAYFKIRAIPTYFIVDKEGTIVSTHVGGDPEQKLKKLYRKN